MKASTRQGLQIVACMVILGAFPLVYSIPWGSLMQLVLDTVTVVMGGVLFYSFAHMFATAWSRTWHT